MTEENARQTRRMSNVSASSTSTPQRVQGVSNLAVQLHFLTYHREKISKSEDTKPQTHIHSHHLSCKTLQGVYRSRCLAQYLGLFPPTTAIKNSGWSSTKMKTDTPTSLY
jgi:hypothetical protein